MEFEAWLLEQCQAAVGIEVGVPRWALFDLRGWRLAHERGIVPIAVTRTPVDDSRAETYVLLVAVAVASGGSGLQGPAPPSSAELANSEAVRVLKVTIFQDTNVGNDRDDLRPG